MAYIKVGILTWHDPTNFGSALQAYALQCYLQRLGFDAHIINYVPQWCRGDYMLMPFKTLSKKKKLMRIVKSTLVPVYYHLPLFVQKRISPFFPFYHQFCNMTSSCTEESIAEICMPFSTIISGSDQIWNPDFIDPIFLQTFASSAQNKISYSASLGVKQLPVDKTSLYKHALSSFTAISVREKEGQAIVRSLGYDAEVHVDPTLLIAAEHYRSIAKPVLELKKPFIFCYFLSTDREYKSYVQKYATEHNLEIVGFSFDSNDYQWMQKISILGPREWLWLIDNAAMVLTNSYHATILSLVLHTPFFTFLRFDRTNQRSQNARLEQLNEYFDIEQYLVDADLPKIVPYDFSIFDKRLHALQLKAEEYLLKHIK